MSNKILKLSTVILVGAHLFCLTNINRCEAMVPENVERQGLRRAVGNIDHRDEEVRIENLVGQGLNIARVSSIIYGAHFGKDWAMGRVLAHVATACSTNSWPWGVIMDPICASVNTQYWKPHVELMAPIIGGILSPLALEVGITTGSSIYQTSTKFCQAIFGNNVAEEYGLRLISKNPSPENLSKINPRELGLFCEGDKLYCKTHNKGKMKIIKSDNPADGLHSEIYDRILNTLQDRMNPIYGQAALAQEEERQHKTAHTLYNGAFEKITLEDEKVLLQYTLLRGYTLPEEERLNKKDYVIAALTAGTLIYFGSAF